MVSYTFFSLLLLLENILIENKTYSKLTKIDFKTLSINISKSLKVEVTGSAFLYRNL